MKDVAVGKMEQLSGTGGGANLGGGTSFGGGVPEGNLTNLSGDTSLKTFVVSWWRPDGGECTEEVRAIDSRAATRAIRDTHSRAELGQHIGTRLKSALPCPTDGCAACERYEPPLDTFLRISKYEGIYGNEEKMQEYIHFLEDLHRRVLKTAHQNLEDSLSLDPVALATAGLKALEKMGVPPKIDSGFECESPETRAARGYTHDPVFVAVRHLVDDGDLGGRDAIAGMLLHYFVAFHKLCSESILARLNPRTDIFGGLKL